MGLKAITKLFSSGAFTNNNSFESTSDWSRGIPDSILESIFDQLSGKDLKNCREVCKTWSVLAAPQLTEKTCVLYDCDRTNFKYFSSTRTSKRLVQFLSVSNIGFAAWSEMRVKSLKSGGLKIFLKKLPQDIHFRSLQNITSLEISHCSLKWASMTAFLRLFNNLKVYKDIMNENHIGNVWRYICGDQQTAFEYVEEKFGMKPFPITSLKIVKKETNSNVNMLMKLLLRTSRELESFELRLVNNDFGWIPATDRTEFVTILGFFILKQTRTLQHLTFSWYCARNNFYFDDFMHCLSIIFAGELQLCTLSLHFEWIALIHDDIESLLIPFINRFTNLKKLCLAKIILHPQSAHRLEQLRPANSPDCECEFSLIFSDHTSLENHQQILNILEGSSVMVNAVYSIRVSVSEMYTNELSQLITVDNGPTVYYHTKELLVNIAWFPFGTEFRRFNISLIVYAFPNLTTLWILDGPRFMYKGSSNVRRQWQKMSPASIGDAEMQMIIDGLPNLKSLRLRARLATLTDCGLTGLTPQAREKMISSKDIEFLDPYADFCCSSLSKLQNLEELMLKGLGNAITDISVYLAFNDLPKLKIIHIFGATSITKTGKLLLYRIFPKANGCTIHTNL